MKDRQEMIRVIRDGAGNVMIDESQKKNGRGSYLCRSTACIATAQKRRSLERTLKCSVDQAVYEDLKRMTEACDE